MHHVLFRLQCKIIIALTVRQKSHRCRKPLLIYVQRSIKFPGLEGVSFLSVLAVRREGPVAEKPKMSWDTALKQQPLEKCSWRAINVVNDKNNKMFIKTPKKGGVDHSKEVVITEKHH